MAVTTPPSSTDASVEPGSMVTVLPSRTAEMAPVSAFQSTWAPRASKTARKGRKVRSFCTWVTASVKVSA